MKPLLAVLVLSAAVPATAADVLFPTAGEPARLRLDVAAPEAAWAAFLDKLFAHFDRDGNGSLSATEAARVFPLPLPGGREAAMDFAKLDADRDGKGTPAEFRAFYRAAGFTPVVVVVEPGPAEGLALGDALFRHLDRDGDGTLSAAESRAAPFLLRRFDEDEDEVLTAAELLSPTAPAPPPSAAGVKLADGSTPPAATLRVAEDGRAALDGGGRAFRLSADGSRLTVPGGMCAVGLVAGDPAAGWKAARKFYTAQFQAVSGGKPAGKSVFENDLTAQVLVGLFDAADRDGDGMLSRPELDGFFDLIELGVSCRVVVTLTDRGRTLHDLFDANADWRLDLPELTRGGRALAAGGPRPRGAVPGSYRLAVGRGPVGESFGPVPFGVTVKPKPAAGPVPPRGPRWFRAMDRNGDGFVSAAEFVGVPALFAKWDADGDGRISPDEADRAAPLKP